MGPSAENVKAAPTDPRGHKVQEFKVYWNKPSKRVLVLQYPNRDKIQVLTSARREKPLALRLKPVSGLIEIDLPLPFEEGFYDNMKGVHFGKALKQSKTLQSGGEYGIAGGFGANPQARTGRDNSRASADESEDYLLDNFEEARARGFVLQKLTLGGRIRVFKTGDPIYALGIFRGHDLHLTKVDAICTLQPQYQHLDAVTDNDRSISRAAAAVDHPVTESEARAVNMAVKSADDEELDMSEVGKTLRAMQEEPWQHLEYIDANDSQAYRSYEDDLILTNDSKSGRLVSAMTERQYLDTISAPRVDPTNQGKKVMMSRPWSSSSDEGIVESTDEDDDPSNGDEAAAEETNGKKRSDTMEIDKN